MSLKKVLLTILGCITACDAHSLMSMEECRVVHEPTPDIPANTEQIFDKLPGAALRICTEPSDTNVRYYLRTPVKRTDPDVCHFSEFQLYPLQSENGETSWDDQPPGTDPHGHGTAQPYRSYYMMLGENKCEDQSSQSYARVEDVTPGLFRTLLGFWYQMKSDPEFLEKSIAALPKSDRSDEAIQALRSIAASEDRFVGRIRLIMFFDVDEPDDNGGYVIEISGTTESHLHLTVDLMPDGFRLKSVRLAIF